MTQMVVQNLWELRELFIPSLVPERPQAANFVSLGFKWFVSCNKNRSPSIHAGFSPRIGSHGVKEHWCCMARTLVHGSRSPAELSLLPATSICSDLAAHVPR